MEKAFNLEIKNKELNTEIEKVRSDFKELTTKMEKVEGELEKKGDEVDKFILELKTQTQQRDGRSLELDHSEDSGGFYEDLTGKITRGVVDKIDRINTEELEAERVRHEDTLRKLREGNMKKTTKLKKRKIKEIEEQIQGLGE